MISFCILHSAFCTHLIFWLNFVRSWCHRRMNQKVGEASVSWKFLVFCCCFNVGGVGETPRGETPVSWEKNSILHKSEIWLQHTEIEIIRSIIIQTSLNSAFFFLWSFSCCLWHSSEMWLWNRQSTRDKIYIIYVMCVTNIDWKLQKPSILISSFSYRLHFPKNMSLVHP